MNSFSAEGVNALVEAIQRAHLQFIASADTRDAFEALLDTLLELSGSEFGLIGEVVTEDGEDDGESEVMLRTHAIKDVHWDASTRALHEGRLPKDAEARGLYAVFAELVATAAPVVVNDSASDARLKGRVGNACTSTALMALPLFFSGELVGVAIVANRHDGYATALSAQLEQFCSTCAHLIVAHRENVRRQRAEAALRDSEARFRLVADAAPVLIWMSAGGPGLSFFNEGWLQFRGRALEQESGSGWLDGVHPHDRERCQTVHRAAFDARAPFSVEYRLLRHDGEYRWLLVRGVPRFDPSGVFTGYIGACSDVTDIKLVEEQLSDSRAQYAGVIDSALDAIVTVDERQRIVVFNTAAERMFGYQAEEIVGEPLDKLMPERFRTIHRSHVEVFKTAGERSAEMGAARELRALRANGEEFPIEASISRCRVGGRLLLTVIVRDVTKLRELTAARLAQGQIEAESRAQLAAVIDTALDAIITVDEEQRIRVFNGAAERIFGYRAAEIIGQPLDRLLPERFRTVHHAHVNGFKTAGERPAEMGAARELSALRANGEEFPIEASISRVRVGGKMLLTVIVRDVSKLRELATARQAQASAEAANRAKTVFLSRMSHELRTPLNAVLGFAQLLEMDRTDPLSGRQHEHVGHIMKAGQHLLSMITELLDLTRIEAGQMKVAADTVSVCEIARNSAQMVEKLAADQQVTITTDFDECSRVVATADAMRLTQVLVNLLSNAIKYNHVGGHVRVSVTTPVPGRVGIEVSDDGMGMDAEQVAHLFEVFNRLGRERTAVDGTGIGLSLTKRLVDLMGGEIVVASEPGHGSTFTVNLIRAEER